MEKRCRINTWSFIDNDFIYNEFCDLVTDINTYKVSGKIYYGLK